MNMLLLCQDMYIHSLVRQRTHFYSTLSILCEKFVRIVFQCNILNVVLLIQRWSYQLSLTLCGRMHSICKYTQLL